jgi:arylsulfatase A-like enzyme
MILRSMILSPSKRIRENSCNSWATNSVFFAPLLLCAFALNCFSVSAADRKPNFLFIYTDDQRWDAMSVVQRDQGERARFPWFQTPNMDRIATEGVRFRNAFVTLSLCAPSRAAFLTGRYNHLNGVANNHTFFPADNVTHATLLRAAGYATAYIGKWHMGGERGQRPGFDYSASFIGQGKYVDCPFEINGKPTPTTGWVDDVSTDYAINYIKEHRDKPFDMVIGFKACHGPFDPPERARGRFAGKKARAVPNMAVHAIYHDAEETPKARANAEAAKTAGDVDINLNYFRCISAADDNVGKLLKCLDDLGIAENTVVIFASDNGFYNGEHQLGDKRSCYDESLRIPMLVRYPKNVPKGKVRDEMVLNIDLAPTLLEFAGVSIPSTFQGKSWVPLLENKSTSWRKSFLAEYFYERPYTTTPTVLSVRTDTAKLITYPGHDQWTELFDLVHDPYEIKNLVQDPASQKLLEQMKSELQAQIRASSYRVPPDADKPEADGGAPTKKNKKKKADE